MNEKVLYAFNQAEQEKRLLLYLKKEKIASRKLLGQDKPKTLKELVEGKPSEGTFSLEQLPNLVILSEFSDARLEAFLAAYKEYGLDRSAIKAVVTVHNVTWTLERLVKDCLKERQQFSR